MTCVPIPILGCLDAADEFFKEQLHWITTDPRQEHFFRQFGGMHRLLRELPELRSRASKDVEEINSWFREEKFDIQLEKSDDPNAVYLGSILRLLVKWLIPGVQTTVESEGVTYPAALVRQGVVVWSAKDHPHPVAELETQEGYSVLMTVLDPERPDLFSLHRHAQMIVENIDRPAPFGGVIFPFVDLDDRPDISFLEGLKTQAQGLKWVIAQALQQTRLKMNHIGAKAESGVLMGMETLSMPQPPFVIDKPFLVIFTKDDDILFVAFIGKDAWKDPGTIE
jgi:hypothetical protein